MCTSRSFVAFLFGFFLLTATGCADKLFSDSANGDADSTVGAPVQESAARDGKLRFPQFMDQALSKGTDVAGKYGAQNANLFIAFAEYEADGVTRRVMDQYGVTRRILDEYGVTRRILDEYGVTRRILDEYGVTRRVMDEYGGLTWELLEAFGVTRRIMDEYGVTRRVLEEYAETYEPEIDLRVRINRARPGITIVFVSDLLETFLDEIADDEDIELVEPDVAFNGASLFLRNGFKHSGQMVPWNLAAVGGVFTTFEKDDVDIFILDSGIYTRDMNVVEHKDFTMLFENRDEETWDDSNIIDMPYFDPGETGDWTDGNGHGTHGAGTIGAKNNSEGIKGVAPEARIHSLKVLTDQGQTDITTVVSAIDYVTDFKQQNPLQPVVANLSLGMDLESTAYNIFDEAVKRAVDFGVVVVVSAGNDGADASTYSPAHVYEAITVGAYDPNDQFTDFSNYGSAVDILAPGDGVVSLTHLLSEAENDDNVLLSGTSSAAPHVAAAAALYLSLHPDASPATVKQALINEGQPRIQGVPDGTTNRSLWVGFADDGATKEFEVTKAEWTSETKKFKVQGDGPRLDTVTLFNAARGTELATIVIDEGGNWKYEVTEPAQIPCAVDVQYLGGQRDAVSTREDVAYAPGSCDHLVTLDKAEWKEGDAELIIEGKAASGMTVSIQDARIGGELASLTADSHGDFEWITTPAYVPCAVKAVAGSSETEREVHDADPDSCSQGAGAASPVTLKKAEYDKLKDKLTIEGKAKSQTLVRFLGTASGAEFATATAASNGGFKATLTSPSIVPCTVRAVSDYDGSTAEWPVVEKGTTHAPGDCERSLTLETIKWNATNTELELKGRGMYGATVTFLNARNRSVVFTTTTDNKGKFDHKVSGLQFIPCALIVESQEAALITIESPVENQAANCDRDLVFNLLQYVGNYQRLSAGGRATAGSQVSLTAGGAPLVDVTVAEDGTWRKDLDLSLSGPPPCGVTATSENGDAKTATVSPLMGCTNSFVYVPVVEEIEQNPYSFVTITKAQWNASTQSLFTEGSGYVNMDVSVRNPLNGETFATTQTDTQEKWIATASIEGIIPCTVEVELDQRIATRAVSNAPQNCDDKPYLSLAQWKDGFLSIRGLGGKNMDAELSSAAKGHFATETLRGNGVLDVSYAPNQLAWIPCTVDMTSNNQTVSLPVNGAPDYCDGKPIILLSKWANGQLMLTAQGGFRAPVSVTTTSNGESVATGSFDDNGMFSVALGASQLAYVPCSTTFTTAGMTAIRIVDSAPDACDGTPFINLAKWNAGSLLFTAEGALNGAVRLYSAATGALLYESDFGPTGEVEWMLNGDQGLPYVPADLRIDYKHRPDAAFGSMTVPVVNAPAHVDGNVTIEKAEWKDGALLLVAFGPFDATLQLSSVGRDLPVGTTSLDRLGELEASVATTFAPCTVRVTAGDHFAEAPVVNAPVWCDAQAWLEFGKAAWDAGKKRLILEGEGYDGFGNGFAEVTFHGPDGTQAYSTTLDDGEWVVDLILAPGDLPPCTLEARISASGDAFGMATAAFPVDGICGN